VKKEDSKTLSKSNQIISKRLEELPAESRSKVQMATIAQNPEDINYAKMSSLIEDIKELKKLDPTVNILGVNTNFSESSPISRVELPSSRLFSAGLSILKKCLGVG